MNYYDTLGINFGATLEEIKSAYKKLALKWHPDKWSTKPEVGRQKAEKQFKKICEAYKALEAEKTRGGNSFYDLEEEIRLTREDLKAEREQLREERITFTREKFAYNWICPEVGHQFENPPLDSNLWAPYASWMEKMRKCSNEEINDFVKKLWEAAEEFGRKKNEDFEKQLNDSEKSGKLKTEILNEIQVKFKSSKILSFDLESSLWSPHNLWAEKLVSLNSESELENFKNQMLNAIEAARIKKNNEEDENRRDLPPPNQPPLDNLNTPPNNSNSSFQSSQNNSSWSKWFEENKLTIIIVVPIVIVVILLIIYKVVKDKTPK